MSKFVGLKVEGYLFSGFEGSDHASVDLFIDKKHIQLLNINFDPKGEKEGMWGYPLPSSKMDTKQWSAHCQKAKEAIDKLGGLKNFSKLAKELKFDKKR